MNPKDEKYLFSEDNIRRFIPSQPEMQSGVLFPPPASGTQLLKPLDKNAPLPPIDEFMGGLGRRPRPAPPASKAASVSVERKMVPEKKPTGFLGFDALNK